MTQFISQFIGELSLKFYIFQVITILVLFLYGFILISLIRKNNISFLDILLAFPLSLIVYSCTGYFLLSFGIPFTRISVIIGMLIILSVALLFAKSSIKADKDINNMAGNCNSDSGKGINHLSKKYLLMAAAIVIFLAMIATSGVFSVSTTNDSMYFFQEYPRALIYYGELVSYLDNFLTDASQGIAIIGTIPFFFGFDEIFGIIIFLNFNFILIFVYAVFDFCKSRLDAKKSYVLTAIAFLILTSSMPYIIMSRWFMANMFFMEYMFIFIYLSYKYEKDINGPSLVILSFFITGLSLMRMEGALNAGILIACVMMLGYKNRDLILYFLCPMLILQAMYLFRIFGILTLHTGIQFMTKEKAIILIAFLLALIAYCMLIRKKVFLKIQKHYSLILPLGFLGLNVLILAYDRADYITNMKAFILNVTRNSGWGLFVSVIIGILIMVPFKSMKINYFDITVICYVLSTIVVGWARGDTLCESFGDSGNRILIQVVPLLVFAVVIKIIEGFEYWKSEKTN